MSCETRNNMYWFLGGALFSSALLGLLLLGAIAIASDKITQADKLEMQSIAAACIAKDRKNFSDCVLSCKIESYVRWDKRKLQNKREDYCRHYLAENWTTHQQTETET